MPWINGHIRKIMNKRYRWTPQTGKGSTMECIQETEKQSYWKQEFKNVTKCSSKDFWKLVSKITHKKKETIIGPVKDHWWFPSISFIYLFIIEVPQKKSMKWSLLWSNYQQVLFSFPSTLSSNLKRHWHEFQLLVICYVDNDRFVAFYTQFFYQVLTYVVLLPSWTKQFIWIVLFPFLKMSGFVWSATTFSCSCVLFIEAVWVLASPSVTCKTCAFLS